jgi:hypothetical protein
MVEDVDRRKLKTPIYDKTQRRKVKHYMNTLNKSFNIDEEFEDIDEEFEDYDDFEEEINKK